MILSSNFPTEPAQVTRKRPLVVDGMYGIGDAIHQRAVMRELMKTHTVWLKTCHYRVYEDLIAEGLNLIFKPTRLRAQSKTIAREAPFFPIAPAPPPGAHVIKLWYRKDQIDKYGSILEAMIGTCGVTCTAPDFTMPVPAAWEAMLAGWLADANPNNLPIMVHRPIVLRREWNSFNRNPDPAAYDALYREAHKGFFVISIADLLLGEEWIVGPEQEVDLKLHCGELCFEEMAALWKRASLVFCNAGFAPVLAQAVGTPSIIVYGGRESYQTTQRAGAHLTPTLGIDADKPCDCHTEKHHCGDKQITLGPALDRVRAFAEKHRAESVREVA